MQAMMSKGALLKAQRCIPRFPSLKAKLLLSQALFSCSLGRSRFFGGLLDLSTSSTDLLDSSDAQSLMV